METFASIFKLTRIRHTIQFVLLQAFMNFVHYLSVFLLTDKALIDVSMVHLETFLFEICRTPIEEPQLDVFFQKHASLEIVLKFINKSHRIS